MKITSARFLFRALFALFLVFTTRAAWGSPYGVRPERAFQSNPTVRKGVDLLLRVPYDTILYGEFPHIYVGIKNASGVPLQVVEALYENEAQQLHIEARADPAGLNLTKPSIYSWERLIGDRSRLQEIPNGDYRIYEFQRGGFNTTYDPLPRTTREIRVRLLTEGNEWVFSNWVSIKRLDDRRLADAEIVKVFDDYFGWKLTIRKATIDDASYIFVDHVRVARIPEGSSLRFGWDKVSKLLTVFFDGVAVPPLILYYQHWQTREWSPQTAPHMVVLEDLKKELGRSGPSALPAAPKAGAVQKSAPPAKPTESGSSNDQTSKSRDRSTWFWVTGPLVLLALLAWLATKRRRSSAKSKEQP